MLTSAGPRPSPTGCLPLSDQRHALTMCKLCSRTAIPLSLLATRLAHNGVRVKARLLSWAPELPRPLYQPRLSARAAWGLVLVRCPVPVPAVDKPSSHSCLLVPLSCSDGGVPLYRFCEKVELKSKSGNDHQRCSLVVM